MTPNLKHQKWDRATRRVAKDAAKRNRGAEQEHREILKAALNGPKRRPLAVVLASIPDVGEDSDFLREQRDRRD